MYRLRSTPYFERRLRRFRRRHPELDERLAGLLRDLSVDPFQPHLRTHALQGDLAGLHAASLSRDYRVLIQILADESEIALVDIGTHDEVYR